MNSIWFSISDLNITIEEAFQLYEMFGTVFNFHKFGNMKVAIELEKED